MQISKIVSYNGWAVFGWGVVGGGWGGALFVCKQVLYTHLGIYLKYMSKFGG